MIKSSLLIIGAGPMGQAHAKAAKALLKEGVAVYAPTDKNAGPVRELGVEFVSGRLESILREKKATHAIVATPVELLAGTTRQLLDAGFKNILVEKPAFLTLSSGRELRDLAREHGATIHVAYNRRFYQSALTALERIEKNGEKLDNVFFEFTEWSHQIVKLDSIKPEVKERWLLANSMHVIDLAFSPTGLPDYDASKFVRQGSLSWHQAASTMVGAGKTRKGIPFSYLANWAAPGRWGVEWITDKNRYIFRPMEQLKVQALGSVAITDAELTSKLDTDYKPGVFLQNQAFLEGAKDPRLVSLDFALELGELACRMAGYPAD